MTLYIEDIFSGAASQNTEVTLRGWVYNSRSSGKVKFLLLRDGTATIQCVFFPKSSGPEAMALFDRLNQESSVELSGQLTESPKAPGGWELQVTGGRLVGEAVEYPITPKEHGAHFLLDRRHLWMRSKRQHAILRIRSEVLHAAREFFDGRGFINFDAPIFTANACEGTTDLFEVNYFDEHKAYLSQSGQLYAEAGAMALGKVYVLGPTFRAEKSKTRRHLTEFWMLEPEVAYMDLTQNMELAEDMLCHIVQRVLKTRQAELSHLERDLTQLEKIKKPFARIHYKEAAQILIKESAEGFQVGSDFGAPDETLLANKFDGPLFVHHFPKAIKAFYMKEDPDDADSCLSYDLLAPEGYGEIIGAGQREDSLEILERKIQEHKLPKESFEWYLDLRRYGSVPHGGFGMGIERCTAWLCGTSHVRECIPFPRMLYRLHP